MDAAYVLSILLFQLPCFALFVVGVVRSRGVARILLGVWLGLSAVSLVLSVATPALFGALGPSGFGLVSGIVNLAASALLGVALIIGRPGYATDRPELGVVDGAYPLQPFRGQQAYGQQPPQGYGQQPPQGYGQ